MGDGAIILPSPLPVTLDSSGHFSVKLADTSDPTWQPSGWLWQVTEVMDGGRDPWAFELTADSDIDDLAGVPVPPDFGMYDLTVADTITGAPGTDAAVTIAGNAPNQALTFTIPQGDVGDTGPTATVDAGATTTGAAGSSAAVANSGTPEAAVFDFTIPRGRQG